MKENRSTLNKSTHNRFRLVIVLLVLCFTYTVWFSFAVVSDDGMLPSLKDGDIIMYNKLAIYFGGIDRSDVLIFNDENGNISLGRVIALSNEKIQISANKTYINGILLDESGYYTGTVADMEQMLIPEGFVFVMPDNRNAVSLSTEAMLISVNDIVGIAALRVSPLNRIGVFA